MQAAVRIGVDVGGTNTDAVLLRGAQVIGSRKAATTDDIGGGIVTAIREMLAGSDVAARDVAVAMIGTTQFTNALVERSSLCRVGVLRLAAPATLSIRPLTDWPSALKAAIGGHVEIAAGGFNYDGRPINAIDTAEIRRAAQAFRSHGAEAVAVSSVFAPVNAAHEIEAAQILRDECPDLRVVESFQIGRIGLIERENAAILNAALLPMAERVVASFGRALEDLGIGAPFYVSQNDGTLLDPEVVGRFPVLTFASGPTNSMRGAAFLSGEPDALVMDIGGTTTDVGALARGLPRESSVSVDIGGVRTNFRMPDLVSVGLGGGSVVQVANGRVQVGPHSVGYRLERDALVFGGSVLTATDIAVAAGYARIGDPGRVAHLGRALVDAAVDEIHRLAEDALDRVKTTAAAVPVVLVGGGSVLIGRHIAGASSIAIPAEAGVANAIGAAIAQVSGTVDRVYSFEKLGRNGALEQAREEATASAVAAGARPDTVEIAELDELPLQYLPGGAVRIRAKAIGDLAITHPITGAA